VNIYQIKRGYVLKAIIVTVTTARTRAEENTCSKGRGTEAAPRTLSNEELRKMLISSHRYGDINNRHGSSDRET
jgi:hypothetical protein